MDATEYKILKDRMFAKKEEYYKEHAELGNWVKTRRIMKKIMIGLCVLRTVLTLIVMVQTQSDGGYLREIFGLFFQLLLVSIFMNPEGNWKYNFILYLWFLTNAITLIVYPEIFLKLPEYFTYMPAYGLLALIEILRPFIYLVFAIYLTAFKKSRKLSERVEEVFKKTVEEINEAVKQNN